MRELFVPLFLVAVLGSMLLPLPATAIDFLLVGNLVLALSLFVSTLYVTDSLKLSSLPGLLLIATLYRLALNVATTRAILATGDAGEVVEAFGKVVISGNIVVGLIIFLIITLIQFVVIAKGAERVAEVAARFTLDALPGKQMSIDADVRAGLIDTETAARKRDELQVESRFYGALDGAMKFIKGDAIAGLIMTGINIIGGLLIGILMQGLEPSAAILRYTLLSIGDGLLSQIPALLNALAAGMVVTRVARGKESNLAQELIGQLAQDPRARLIIGCISVGMAAVPGLPFLPFLTLGVIFFLASAKKAPRPVTQRSEEKFEPRPPPVLGVEIGKEIAERLQGAIRLGSAIQSFRREVHETTGLILALPEFSKSASLGNAYQIKLRGIPVATTTCELSGDDLINEIVTTLTKVANEVKAELVDDILTRRLLDFFDKEAPELVSAVVPQIVSVTQLTEILRNLVIEGLSVRSFDVILQAIGEFGTKGQGERYLLEEVRIALKRMISAQHVKDGELRAITVDPLIDLLVVRTEREGKPIDLELLDAIIEGAHSAPDAEAVVVSRGARRLIAECFRIKGVTLPVLAFEELTTDTKVISSHHVKGDESALSERLAA